MNELGSSEQRQPKKYDTTLARIAGNIAAGLVGRGEYHGRQRVSVALVVADALAIARGIVAELSRPVEESWTFTHEGGAAGKLVVVLTAEQAQKIREYLERADQPGV